ncbi:MAG: bifunctional hydroxymethylpyrimidine kinase/phosphomethylpyrimidine kinase [Cyclobacteriaceae bacterium]
MKKYISVLSIAGSDSGGGAGIQADLKTMSALGCFGTTAITAITVQNTLGVSQIHPVPVDIIAGQVQAVMEDIQPKAIKIGMVNKPEVVEMLATLLQKYPEVPVVFDPVMVASSGCLLIEEETVQMLWEYLFPLSALITPNLDEAGTLVGYPILNLEEMQLASKKIQLKAGTNVLLKGGHLQGNPIYDVLCEGSSLLHIFTGNRIYTHNTHGTGCSLSSAIACEMAKGCSLLKAVENARKFINGALAEGRNVQTGKGEGPLNHFYQPQKLIINELE